MSELRQLAPPRVRLDGTLVNDLDWRDGSQLLPGNSDPGLPPAFHRYERNLTRGGGFRVTYCDQAAGPLLTTARVLAWSATTGFSSWALFFKSNFANSHCLIALAAVGLLSALLVRYRWLRSHSIEIRPDGMIVDGRFFSLEGIGESRPALHMIDDNENRIEFVGLFGTRFVRFATVNRCSKYDRTPERLAEDLALAMEQLWDRDEPIASIEG